MILLLSLALASPAPAQALVATYRDGRVTAADVSEWSRFVTLDRGAAPRLDARAQAEEMVVQLTLARRFDATPSASSPEARIRIQQLEWRLAERALRQHVLAAAAPSERELTAAYRTRLPALRQPRRWGLEDIFKAFPRDATEAQKAATRAALRGARERIVGGASFADVARAESESSTRLRGGAMGFVTLDRLAPALARVVADLHPGDLSPLVELPAGVVVVRCASFVDAHEPTFAEARDSLTVSLRNERFEVLWRETGERAVAALDPRDRKPSAAEIRAFAEDHIGKGEPTPDETAADPARGLIALVAHARAAERLGLTRTADNALVLRWRTIELKAQLQANESTRALIVEPTETELRDAFAAQAAGWNEPRKQRLRLLKVSVRQDLPAAFYERVRSLGRELAASGGSLEAAAAALAPQAEIKDLGWLTDGDVWQLGVNIDAAVQELKPGAFSSAVQEGPSLVILQLQERRPERRLDFEEARPHVRAALLDRRRREAGQRLRAQTLAQQDVHMVAP